MRADVESKLIRQLSQRPTKIELQQKNIIPRDKSVRDQEFEDRKVLLERKLSRRPTVKELRDRRILMYVGYYGDTIITRSLECNNYVIYNFIRVRAYNFMRMAGCRLRCVCNRWR